MDSEAQMQELREAAVDHGGPYYGDWLSLADYLPTPYLAVYLLVEAKGAYGDPVGLVDEGCWTGTGWMRAKRGVNGPDWCEPFDEDDGLVIAWQPLWTPKPVFGQRAAWLVDEAKAWYAKNAQSFSGQAPQPETAPLATLPPDNEQDAPR